jgi:hypothetical protein
VRGTIAAHVELAVADSDSLASAFMFMRDLVSSGRTVIAANRAASSQALSGGLSGA